MSRKWTRKEFFLRFICVDELHSGQLEFFEAYLDRKNACYLADPGEGKIVAVITANGARVFRNDATPEGYVVMAP